MKILRNNTCQGKGGLDWEDMVLDENKLGGCSRGNKKATNVRDKLNFSYVNTRPLSCLMFSLNIN